MAANQITGRSAFLALLKDEGITHLFEIPPTELPIMHALKDHPDLTYVMGMQESVVVAMADGYSRAQPANWLPAMSMSRRVSAMRWAPSITVSLPARR